MANRMRIFQTSSMVFLALLVPVGSASASDLSKFLDGLFKQIANRAPSGSELNYYTNLTRNQGPLESRHRVVRFGRLLRWPSSSRYESLRFPALPGLSPPRAAYR